MPSSLEPGAALKVGDKAGTFAIWNRKAHYFAGLYFLFFLWLFALTGLLLNHSQWEFAQFWPGRKVTSSEHAIQPTAGLNSLQDARDVCRQLGISGEIDWVTTRPEPTRLDFRVNRPGLNLEIKADFRTGRATVQRTEVNAWGIARVLHTFTGVRVNDPRKNQRDWIVTAAWAIAMDAVAIGSILMVASGIIIWWRDGKKLRAGALAFALGTIVCAVFVIGLRWML